MRTPAVPWLGAGVGLAVAGLVAASLGPALLGYVTVGLGAGALAIAFGLEARRRREESTGVDRLEARIAELQSLERWLRAAGISPIEEAHRHLLPSPDEASPLATASAPPAAAGAMAAIASEDEDRRLREMIAARCDRLWQGIAERRYVRYDGDRLKGIDPAALFDELRGAVQEVAELYHADVEEALLEARAGSILLAVRSVAGELVHLLRQVPAADLSRWSIEELLTRLEKVESGVRLYRAYSSYDRYVTATILGLRLAAGSNPISLAAWYLGSRGARHVGEKVLRERVETYLRGLLEGLVAMIYTQAALTYRPERAYATVEWTVLAEAVRIHAAVPGVDHNRKALLGHALAAPLGDELAKLELLRALAADRPAQPIAGLPVVPLEDRAPAERRAIAAQVSLVLGGLRGLGEPAAREAITELENRLGHGLQIDVTASRAPLELVAADALIELARLARAVTTEERDAARRRLLTSPLATALGKRFEGEALAATIDDALERAWKEAPGDHTEVDALVPRSLVGHELASAFAETAIELIAGGREPWSLDSEELVASLVSLAAIERDQLEKLWTCYLERAVERLDQLIVLDERSGVPPALAPSLLRELGDDERPFAARRAQRRDGEGGDVWCLFLPGRLIISRDPGELSLGGEVERLSVPRADVHFERLERRLADHLALRIQHEGLPSEELTVRSGRSGSFERRHGPLLEAMGLGPSGMRALPAP